MQTATRSLRARPATTDIDSQGEFLCWEELPVVNLTQRDRN